MVNLGDKVKDKISGFVGIATGRTEYMYGCVRVVVSPTALHDGKPVDSQCFDEDQLSVEKAGAVPRPATVAAHHGGPMPMPSRHKDPVR